MTYELKITFEWDPERKVLHRLAVFGDESVAPDLPLMLEMALVTVRNMPHWTGKVDLPAMIRDAPVRKPGYVLTESYDSFERLKEAPEWAKDNGWGLLTDADVAMTSPDRIVDIACSGCSKPLRQLDKWVGVPVFCSVKCELDHEGRKLDERIDG